ncbi:hypothetical protein [Salinarimonas sp.]|uniref:hypothetical protein n=1 Tax=Salinarimonas sp. TaxID=2766526 RepID=UPI00391C2BB4
MRRLFPVVGFHGCRSAVADAVLNRGEPLIAKEKDYHWLGQGVYFWVEGYRRAWDWARRHHPDPAVIAAIIRSMNCLDLTDLGSASELKLSYEDLEALHAAADLELPKNQAPANGIPLNRQLDCKVIEHLHEMRKRFGAPDYDTVIGAFEEGSEIYPGAALREETHVQIAVRTPAAILAVFPPSAMGFT